MTASSGTMIWTCKPSGRGVCGMILPSWTTPQIVSATCDLPPVRIRDSSIISGLTSRALDGHGGTSIIASEHINLDGNVAALALLAVREMIQSLEADDPAPPDP